MPPSRPRRRRRTRRYDISVPLAPLAGLPALRAGQRLRGSHWSGTKIVSMLLLGMLAAALYQLSNSYAFFVYGAKIQGNHSLSAEEIYDASAVHQQSIFWLPPREIAKRIQEHPYVKQAVVHCRLPNRVTIEVTERLPRISWWSPQGERWVDDDAVTLPPGGTQRPPLLLMDDEGLATNADGDLHADIAEGMLLVSSLMPEVTQFRYDHTWGLFFQSPHGWHVALGRAERMQDKVPVLNRVQEDILARGRHPQLVDLRFPDTPYYH